MTILWRGYLGYYDALVVPLRDYFISAVILKITKQWLHTGSHQPVLPKKNGEDIRYRPFGYHAMELLPTLEQTIIIDECVVISPILEQFSSIASAWYVFSGIVIGIMMVSMPCVRGDWPLISLALAWTVPAIYVRIVYKKVVIKSPKKLFEHDRIEVKELNPEKLNVQKRNVI